MTRFPSERALAVNAVGELTRRATDGPAVAVDPTALADRPDPTGYPVERSFAARVALRFAAPAYNHETRGLCFELTPGSVATLSLRDQRGAAYVACPRVDGWDDLPAAFDACRFVSVHALRSDTSRLFVPPPESDRPVTAKVRDAADARGFDRDPENYYTVPDDALLSAATLAEQIAAREAGLRIRFDGDPTDDYRAFLDRLVDLDGLYRSGRLVSEAATRLVEHAVAAHEAAAGSADGGVPAPGPERTALRETIDRMREGTDPARFRIRRSWEVVYAAGDAAERLVLGAPLAEHTLDVGGTGDEADGETTTLDEFL